jgi:hypothetical protein
MEERRAALLPWPPVPHLPTPHRRPGLATLLVLALAGCAPGTTGEVQTHPFDSEATGSSYEIQVRTPPGYDAGRALDYPLVLQLDANTQGSAQFEHTAGWTSRYEESGDVPEAIVVGIGHTETGAKVGRLVDFIPPIPEDDAFMAHGEPGGPEFYAMLRDELLPWLSDGWLISIDPDDRVLLGHSLGGLFVLYAMTRHEAGGDDFLGNFVAFDPSVQVGDGVIFGLEQETSERLDDLRVDLFVGVGGATGADFVAWILGFAEQLEGRGYPGLRLRSEVVEGREHLELIEDMPELGLPWVFEQ